MKKLKSLFSALEILRMGARFDFVAPNWYQWGRAVIVLNALFRKPRPIILFEVIDYSLASRSDLTGSLFRMFARLVLGPAMRRSVKFVQVMSLYERKKFIELYGMSEESVTAIPWPLVGWVKPTTPDPKVVRKDHQYVFSSGRASCDWPTLFSAAKGQNWRLVVVCSRADLNEVQVLNQDVGAEVFSEISKSEHDVLLEGATICVISLREEHKSSGQVRLGAAIELRVPVVASAVDGLKEYLLPGTNALTYSAKDSECLRNSVNQLLDQEKRRRDLVETASISSAGYDRSAYFKKISEHVERLHLRSSS